MFIVFSLIGISLDLIKNSDFFADRYASKKMKEIDDYISKKIEEISGEKNASKKTN